MKRVLALLFVGMVFNSPRLFAEPYIGVHGGYLLPLDLTSVMIAGTNIPPGTTSTPIHYEGTGFWGATLGYFTYGIPWLGIAAYVDVSKQNQTNETLTVVTPVWGPIVSTTLSVNSGTGTLSVVETDFLVMFRYPNRYAEPYGGFGVAILGATRTLGTATAYGETIVYNVSASTVAPGLNVRAGIRFAKRWHVAPYIEWKFTLSEFSFFPTGGASSSGISGVKGTFMSNSVLGGLSYVY